MDPSTREQIRLHSLLHAVAGVVLMVVGVSLSQTHMLGLAFAMVVAGVYLAATHLSRLIRIAGSARRDENLAHREFRRRFRRATLPRQIFQLLFAVAEVDGRADERELELVRRFLLERFVDPISASDLRGWEVDRIATEQVGLLAMELRRLLSDAECETVFYWACLVAFADRTFRSGEHEVLQDIARGFGLAGPHARRIFHYAKARFVQGEGLGGRGTPRDHRADGSTRADPRSRAFQVLGLEASATADALKSRYRELVKKNHPDAHAHLGPVAAAEADKRFREIQQAYEFLTGTS